MNNDWIVNDGIASYIQAIYDMVAESVADYGYVQRLAEPNKLVGQSSEMVEHMAVFIKPGKQAKFMNAARSMGVIVQLEKLKAPGATVASECYIFKSGSFMNMNNKIFRQVVRRAVKDAQTRTAMMARATQIQK